MRSSHRQNYVVPTARSPWPQRLGVALLAVLLLVLMGRCAVSADELAPPEVLGMSPAELAAFEAGRVAAHADLSGVVAEAYQQGRKDALAHLAKTGEVQP